MVETYSLMCHECDRIVDFAVDVLDKPYIPDILKELKWTVLVDTTDGFTMYFCPQHGG